MEVFHVKNWNLLKEEGFRIVPTEAPESSDNGDGKHG